MFQGLLVVFNAWLPCAKTDCFPSIWFKGFIRISYRERHKARVGNLIITNCYVLLIFFFDCYCNGLPVRYVIPVVKEHST